jgi:L-iditol 2-dehydrogenase
MLINRAAFLVDKMKYEVRETPVPVLKNDDDVLIKMEYVGICGADLDMWHMGRYGIFEVEYPKIIGHEAAGVVVETGKNVTKLKPGDKIALEPGVPCGKCEPCLKGSYNLCSSVVFKGAPPVEGCNQLYVTHPAQWCFKIPDKMSTREGALLEPLAVGMHVANQGDVKMCDVVVINGAGTIGLSTLAICRSKGATKIISIDTSSVRLAAAKELGAITIDFSKENPIEKVLELTNGRGADVVIEASGNAKAFLDCPQMAKAGGIISCVGLGPKAVIDIDYQSLIYKELTLKTSCRYRHEYPCCIDGIASGLINTRGIITHEYALDDIQKGYEFAFNNKDKAIKTIIRLI